MFDQLHTMYYMKPKNKTGSVLQSLPDCFSNLFKVDYKKEILLVMTFKNRKPGTYLSLLSFQFHYKPQLWRI